jgi:ribosomal protein L7/L12
MMKDCESCGHVNHADVKFCGECGTRLAALSRHEKGGTPINEDLPFAVGTTIAQGRYQLDGVLGQGGMGTVYGATDVSLGRPCALKVLNAGLTAHPTARKRMEREARALARIEHPNVVQIRSVFVEGDLLAMELEYMSGGDLRGLIERGGLTPERVVSLMASILSGLQALHEAKLVHRDIKPENVLLDSRGEPKLTDLGVARDDAESGRTRTRLGAVLGTLEYMSPEQIQGLAVDARSDIYACGVMLVQMLTGELPFAAKSDFEWQEAHVRLAPDLARAQTVHAGLAQAAARALAKSPAERWQDAASMADAIQIPTLPRAVTGLIGDMFDVVLVDGGDNKIGVIKVVRELFSLGLADAKRLVENGGVAKAALSRADADYLRKQLTAAGAAVELRPASGRDADPLDVPSTGVGRHGATPPGPSPSSMIEASNSRSIGWFMLGGVVA